MKKICILYSAHADIIVLPESEFTIIQPIVANASIRNADF